MGPQSKEGVVTLDTCCMSAFGVCVCMCTAKGPPGQGGGLLGTIRPEQCCCAGHMEKLMHPCGAFQSPLLQPLKSHCTSRLGIFGYNHTFTKAVLNPFFADPGNCKHLLADKGVPLAITVFRLSQAT